MAKRFNVRHSGLPGKHFSTSGNNSPRNAFITPATFSFCLAPKQKNASRFLLPLLLFSIAFELRRSRTRLYAQSYRAPTHSASSREQRSGLWVSILWYRSRRAGTTAREKRKSVTFYRFFGAAALPALGRSSFGSPSAGFAGLTGPSLTEAFARRSLIPWKFRIDERWA